VHYYPDDTIGADDPYGPGWVMLLEPYLDEMPDNRLFHCPAFPVDDKSVTYFLEARWTHMQSPPLHTMPITRIKLSSQYILSGEVTLQSDYLPPWGNSTAQQDDIDKDDAVSQRLLFFGEDGGYNMHHAGNNILFADGHVDTFKRFDSQKITYCPTALQNWPDVTGN
jgi:prepilin-type processing-associated H-X9-DG protein